MTKSLAPPPLNGHVAVRGSTIPGCAHEAHAEEASEVATLPAGQRALERRLRAELREKMRELLAEHGTGVEQFRTLIEHQLTIYQREAGATGRPRLLDPAGSSERIAWHLFGDGPLVPLLAHPRVSDIWINGPKRILYRLDGDIYLADDVFDGDEDVQQLVKRWLAPLGLRSPDASWPFVDARLPNGARLHAAMPPATTRYTVVSLRRYTVAARSLAELVWPEEGPAEDGPYPVHGQRIGGPRPAEVWASLQAPLHRADAGHSGMLPPALGSFLIACVAAGVPIVISGPPGSGKTTVLRALCAAIPPWARLVTLEDTLELDVEEHLANAVALLTRAPNVEGKGAITLRHLVREALRMAPDYAVVGEVRGEETWDLLNALQNGCTALATVHGLSCEDALERIAMRALEAGAHMSYDQLLQFVAATVGIVVQVRREPAPRSGQPRHRVVQVYEVVGVTGDRSRLQGHDLWTLDPRTEQLVSTGTTPRCLGRIATVGIPYAPPTVRPVTEHE